MLAVLVVLVLTLALIYYFNDDGLKEAPKHYWKKRGIPELDRNSTDIINYYMKKSRIEVQLEIYNSLPDARVIGIYDQKAAKLYVKDIELIKRITVKDFDHFIDRPQLIQPHHEPIWAKNLFALTGQKWRDMRTILSPAFTSSKMKLMYSLVCDISENLVNHFKQMKDAIIEIEMKDVATRFTNDAIATTAFGISCDSLKQPNNEFYLMGKSLTDFNFRSIFKRLKYIIYRAIPYLDYIRPRRVFNRQAMDSLISLIDETVKVREEKNIVRPDMIHLLLEARKGVSKDDDSNEVDTGFATVVESNLTSKVASAKKLTNKDIAAQAVVFFFAGFDSVSSFLSNASYELAVNPEVQNRLRKEIEETSEAAKGGKVTYEAIMKMKYMDMVVSESLRKWPNVFNLDRLCIKDYIYEPADGKAILIEKGTHIIIPTFAIHRDPENYPDPEIFDPERFNDENKHNINPYAYLPFGLGPRSCIGSRLALMEGKIMLFNLLKNFEIVTTEKTSIPPKISKKTGAFATESMHLGLKKLR